MITIIPQFAVRVARVTDMCQCSSVHRPMVMEPQHHHLWPLYLGGPEHPGTLLLLCPTTHTNVHRLLRAMVRAGKILPRHQGDPHYSWATACNGFLAWDAAGRPKPHD